MNDELEGFRPTRYLARSWALLTRDRGWIKPVLVMFAALLVPVVGALGVLGYVVEWARLTAWGYVSSPKQSRVQVGACIASGWRAFVVMLVWGLCWGIVGVVAGAIPLLGDLLDAVWWILTLMFGVVVMVAIMRATIYQKIRAGLRVSAVWEMVRRDASGLLRVFGMDLAGGAIVSLVALIGAIVGLASVAGHFVHYVDYALTYGRVLDDYMALGAVLEALASMFSAAMPALTVTTVVSLLIEVVMTLLLFTAVALWMRQFDVASWGREGDPLPESAAAPAADGPYPVGLPGQAPQAEKDAQVENNAPAEKDAPSVLAPESPASPEPSDDPFSAADPTRTE